jgi:hypothetical protein
MLKQRKVKTLLKRKHSGVYHQVIRFQNKIGASIPMSLKRKIRDSGKPMRRNFGKTITPM